MKSKFSFSSLCAGEQRTDSTRNTRWITPLFLLWPYEAGEGCVGLWARATKAFCLCPPLYFPTIAVIWSKRSLLLVSLSFRVSALYVFPNAAVSQNWGGGESLTFSELRFLNFDYVNLCYLLFWISPFRFFPDVGWSVLLHDNVKQRYVIVRALVYECVCTCITQIRSEWKYASDGNA